jgi:Tfp pilus assembly protein PilF
MRKARLVMIAVLAAAGLVAIGGGVLAPDTAFAAKKDKAPKLSPEVHKPLAEAQEAMNAKDWDTALMYINEAEAVQPKEPYDEFMVNELGWYVYVQKDDFAKAGAALEASVNSGFLAEDTLPARYKPLAQIYGQGQNYPKAIEYGNKALAVDPTDASVALLVAQCYNLSEDYAGARTAVDTMIANGAPATEDLLMQSLIASNELNDQAGIDRALQQLVRVAPETKYWEDLLNAQLYKNNTDRELRALYRLMDDTGTLNKGDEFAEMGSVLLAAGFPSEAMGVLQRGMEQNAYDGSNKSNAQASLAQASKDAAADAKDVASAASSLASAKTGNQKVAIGKLYFSTGDYAKAADAIAQGLAAGGLTDTDDAKMLMGIAYARSGNAAEARKAFDSLSNPRMVEVGSLWKLYLDTTQGAPAA